MCFIVRKYYDGAVMVHLPERNYNGSARKRKWSLMTGAKDPLPSQSLPGVVYALGCTECPRIYVGETERTAGRRAEEHQAHLR